ncbi:MAG: Bug family tripartite tricarboxylate transporter substrate binding protein [Pseudolabrys sp.]
MSFPKVITALMVSIMMAIAQPACANDSYPTKPVKLVVPFPPGGTTDIVARILAQKLGEALGKSFVVENKAGAGGLVGADYVAKSEADGYTLLLGNSGALATALKLVPSVPYDVMRDFTPISMISDVTIVLAVHPSVPAKNVAELVAYAKSQPGKLNIAIPSIGSMHHLLTEMFKMSAGISAVSVPYKGSAPAVVDLMAGQVQMDFDNLPALATYVDSGKVRALAVASAERSAFLPNIPSMKEAGFPDIVASPWFAMVAPTGTPRPIIQKLNREIVKIMQSDDMKKRLHDQGANARWSTPEECGAFIRTEIDRWAEVVRKANLKM